MFGDRRRGLVVLGYLEREGETERDSERLYIGMCIIF